MRTAAATGLLFGLVFTGGCGSSHPSGETAPPSRPQQVQPHGTFETKTDTVNAVRRAERLKTAAPVRETQVRFMVQIGAYKDPREASHQQIIARQRYHMPVLNDYNEKHGLYQIRIGFFVSRNAARAFRLRLLKEYPADYKDAWVVQLKR